MKKSSVYADSRIVLTTKHQKAKAIAPHFQKNLAAEIMECELDTDTLGTFSGEVPRINSAVECARQKCLWGMEVFDADYGLANEGSFGPDRYLSFMPCNYEVLYFIDSKLGFELKLSYSSNKTNYQMGAFDSIERIIDFTKKALFPSHGLIVRPNLCVNKGILFKGIQSYDSLCQAYEESRKHSSDHQVWIETDMRAHMNPSRMQVIGLLAERFSQQLNNYCPECQMPGWGRIDVENGLPCSECGLESSLIKTEIFGCVACPHRENKPRHDDLSNASPMHCAYCNP